MPLSIADQAFLDQCRAARAALLTGQQVTEVTSGGRTIRYAATDLDKLEAMIARLEEQAERLTPTRRRGAVGFTL